MFRRICNLTIVVFCREGGGEREGKRMRMGKVCLFINIILYCLKMFNKIHMSTDISNYIIYIVIYVKYTGSQFIKSQST